MDNTCTYTRAYIQGAVNNLTTELTGKALLYGNGLSARLEAEIDMAITILAQRVAEAIERSKA